MASMAARMVLLALAAVLLAATLAAAAPDTPALSREAHAAAFTTELEAAAAHSLAPRGFDFGDFTSLFGKGLSPGCFFGLLDPKLVQILVNCNLISLLSGLSLVVSPNLQANYDAAVAFQNALPGLCGGSCADRIREWGDVVVPRCGTEVIIDIGPVLEKNKDEISPTLQGFLQPLGTQFTAKDVVDLALAALDVGCQKPKPGSNSTNDWCVFDLVRTVGPVLSGLGNSSSDGALQGALGVLTNPDFLCANCTISVVSALDRASYSSRVVGAYKQYVSLIVNFVVASCDPNGGPKPNATMTLPAGLGGSTPAQALPLTSDGTCPAGFGGLECNICTADAGCAAVNSSRPTCGQGALVVSGQSNSQCAVDEPMLTTLFPGAPIRVALARNLPQGTAVGSIYYGPQLNFRCAFSRCTRRLAGGADVWDCADARCDCVKGAKMCGEPGSLVDLTGPLSSVTGPFTLDCPFDAAGNGTECRFRVDQLKGILPQGIKLSGCAHGECLASREQTSQAAGAAPAAAETRTVNTAAVAGGAAAVGALLLVCCGSFAFAKAGQVKARKAVVDDVGTRGADVAFEGVGYEVGKRGKKGHRVVLEGVSGRAAAGRITAIMGPSGSGKSSLLDLVAGKAKAGRVTGAFSAGGEPVARRKLAKRVAFVDQEDHFLPYMTVRECVAFSARCRLPEGFPDAAREARVDAVIASLGLAHVAGTRVGGSGVRGVSGGERRRVSIACELVTGSGIIALDEPTSGLDSHTAASLLRTLKDLAAEGKTVVLSIHQPSSDAFRLLDDLVLLSKGKVMYAGKARAAKAHFAGRGFECPEDYNVADYLLDLAVEQADTLSRSGVRSYSVGGDPEKPASEISYAIEDSSVRHLRKSADGSTGASEEEAEPEGADYPTLAAQASQPKVSVLTRLSAVCGRSLRTLLRDPSLLVAHLAVAVALGLLVGGLYFKSPQTIGGLQNKLGGMFFVLALLGFSALSALGVLAGERLLFVRERAAGYYGPAAFSFAKMLFDLLPLRAVPALIVGSTAYWMVGLTPTADAFLKFLLVLVLFDCAAALLCMCAAAGIQDPGTANLACSIFMLFSMLFGGFLINLATIPAALSWIQYLSIFRYATEALAVNEAADSMIVDNLEGISISIPASTILGKLFGFDLGSYWTNAFALVGWNVGLAVLFVLLVRFRLVERR
ncbi:hypothetical protein DFJ74DRAFT_773818 [Hyaloraphidium curvatum]|nr:hypothetical protein DFJ74DRAFT_773818 [Hyaloraphidium curvatum]